MFFKIIAWVHNAGNASLGVIGVGLSAVFFCEYGHAPAGLAKATGKTKPGNATADDNGVVVLRLPVSIYAVGCSQGTGLLIRWLVVWAISSRLLIEDHRFVVINEDSVLQVPTDCLGEDDFF